MTPKTVSQYLTVHPALDQFVRNVIDQLSQEQRQGLTVERFWQGFERACATLVPLNAALLRERDQLQDKLDHWCREVREKHLHSSTIAQDTDNTTHSSNPLPYKVKEYKNFLEEIGYIERLDKAILNATHFVDTQHIDNEIASVPGPQLVVPLSNARFALNAANARWGSLFDAIYGSDIISETDGLEQIVDPPQIPDKNSNTPAAASSTYNPRRGAETIRIAVAYLDAFLPLTNQATYASIRLAGIRRRNPSTGDAAYKQHFWDAVFLTPSGVYVTLQQLDLFVGFTGPVPVVSDREEETDRPSVGKYSLLFLHHGLHIELTFDFSRQQCRDQHSAALADVQFEAAVSTIQDCEDAVSAVNVEEKLHLYQNWLGLMTGTLSAPVVRGKGKPTIIRSLNKDRSYTRATAENVVTTSDSSSPNGAEDPVYVCHGRSLLLIRHVGHHMYTDMVRFRQERIPETFVDAFVTTLIALNDVRGSSNRPFSNSRQQSIYAVKPKLHGPKEIRLVDTLFTYVEQTLGLPAYTIKCGIMDEERRTSVNLKACVWEARHRIFFINTGFLDRTGDEIHSSLELGPFQPKPMLKNAEWIQAYEENNVLVGLVCGLRQKGQIGKGMWANPDCMKAMLKEKKAQLLAGATTAWVPSPKAATLHVLHYHEVDVLQVLASMEKELGLTLDSTPPHKLSFETRLASCSEKLLHIPVLLPLGSHSLPETEIQRELDNNVQGILGYVVRWINMGIGCSKVPNIDGVNLMEDRATLRISSQHIANWLRHGVVSEIRVFDTFRRMAAVVDSQNQQGFEQYTLPMAPSPVTSIAFQAALELVFKGTRQPNGYTEFILHQRRQEILSGCQTLTKVSSP